MRECLKPDEIKDHFILSMDWPWRAPDRETFSSSLDIPVGKVFESSPDSPITFLGGGEVKKVSISLPEQLRIRTLVSGSSTINFALKKSKKSLGRAQYNFNIEEMLEKYRQKRAMIDLEDHNKIQDQIDLESTGEDNKIVATITVEIIKE